MVPRVTHEINWQPSRCWLAECTTNKRGQAVQTRYVYAAQVEFEQPPRHSRPLVHEDLTECSCITGGMTAVLLCVGLQHSAPRGTVL